MFETVDLTPKVFEPVPNEWLRVSKSSWNQILKTLPELKQDCDDVLFDRLTRLVLTTENVKAACFACCGHHIPLRYLEELGVLGIWDGQTAEGKWCSTRVSTKVRARAYELFVNYFILKEQQDTCEKERNDARTMSFEQYKQKYGHAGTRNGRTDGFENISESLGHLEGTTEETIRL